MMHGFGADGGLCVRSASSFSSSSSWAFFGRNLIELGLQISAKDLLQRRKQATRKRHGINH